MLKFILNSRFLLVFAIPFSLGCLSVFSFQPFNFSIINFLVLPCLFFLICYINKKSQNIYRKKPHLTNLFYVGYLFGIGFFLAGTHWISNSLKFDKSFENFVPVTTILIPLVLGLFYGVGFLAFGKYLKSNIKSIFLFVIILSLIDYIRSKILTGFPWNLWGYSWSWFTEIIQILNPIGLFAFNLLVITVYLVPTIFFLRKSELKYLKLGFISLLVFTNYLYGNYTINNNNLKITEQIKKNQLINIKVVSPNFELKYDLSEKQIENRIKKLIKFSDINKDKKTLFIWPEGALSGQYFFEIEKFKNLIKRNFSEKHLIVLGINTLDKKNDEFFNSFIIIDSKFNKKFQYNKIKLVPFGEFIPQISFLDLIGLKKITEGLGSFSKGKEQNIYSYENTNIIPLICYEIIFTELVQNITENKNMIINISEDGWFGNSIGPHQHFSKAIFRAIESDTYVIRSANKGLSAVINNKGQVIKTLKNNESGNIEYSLPILEKNKGNRNDLIFFILLFTYWFVFLFLKND